MSGNAKAVTIADVARAAGVTAATVSRTLSGKRHGSPRVREAVLRAVAELDYTPNPHAQRLASGQAEKHIDLLSGRLDSGMDARKAQLVQQMLQERGYDAPLHGYGRGDVGTASSAGSGSSGSSGSSGIGGGQRELIASLCRQRPRAIVCDVSGLAAEALPELQSFVESGGEMVAFGYASSRLKCDQVIFDSRHSSRLAIEHLAGLGHKRIGFCFPSQARPSARRAEQAARDMEEHGLPLRPEWIFHPSRKGASKGALAEPEEAGEPIALWLAEMPAAERPSALFISNDYAALSFCHHAARLRLRVPHDVSVVGHDDRALARSAPVPITSITHPAEEIARHVASLLDERLHGFSGEPRALFVRGKLLARQSTAPPAR